MDSSDRSLKRADRPTLGEKLSPETKQTKLNQIPEEEVTPVARELHFDTAAEELAPQPATTHLATPVNPPASDTGGTEDSLLKQALAKIAELESKMAAHALQTPPPKPATSSPDPSKTPVATPHTDTSSGASGVADKDDDEKDDEPPVGPLNDEDMVCMPGGKVVSWMNDFNLQMGALVINGLLGVLCSKLLR